MRASWSPTWRPIPCLLKTSSVIWSNQRELLKAAVGAAERALRREVAVANPLIPGDEKIVPNITKCSAAARTCTSLSTSTTPRPTRQTTASAASG